MARIKPSAKIDQVRGKVGDLIFAGVRGAAVAKRHVQGPDRKSDSQLSVRSAFTIVKNSWLSLSAEVINSWSRFAKDLRGTGYNFFLSANIAQERVDDWRILTPLNYKVEGVESIGMNPGPEEGEATIFWVGGSANPGHKAWAFVREVETGEVLHEAAWRADVSAGEVEVDGLVVGKEYRFYVAVYDGTEEEGDRFSFSRECWGVTAAEPNIQFESHFEGGNFNEWTSTVIIGEEMDISVSSSRAKVGTYSAVVLINEASAGDRAHCHYDGLNIGSGSHIWASAWMFFGSAFDCEQGFNLLKLYEASSPYKRLTVQMLDNEVLRIEDNINGASYSQNSPIPITKNQWCGIEFHNYAHDSEGIIELWQDGARIIQVTGIDTMPASNFKYFRLGVEYIWGGEWSGPDQFYFDEVYVQDQRKIY